MIKWFFSLLLIPFFLEAAPSDLAKELHKIERAVLEWKRGEVHKILARRVIDATHHLERVLVEEGEVVSLEDFREWYRIIYTLERPGECVFKTHEVTWFLLQTYFFLTVLEKDAKFLKTFHFTFRHLVFLYDEIHKSLLDEYRKTDFSEETTPTPRVGEEKPQDRRNVKKREHREWHNYQRHLEFYYREWVIRSQPEVLAREGLRRFKFFGRRRAMAR